MREGGREGERDRETDRGIDRERERDARARRHTPPQVAQALELSTRLVNGQPVEGAAGLLADIESQVCARASVHSTIRRF